jgi:hypothetical protein
MYPGADTGYGDLQRRRDGVTMPGGEIATMKVVNFSNCTSELPNAVWGWLPRGVPPGILTRALLGYGQRAEIWLCNDASGCGKQRRR